MGRAGRTIPSLPRIHLSTTRNRNENANVTRQIAIVKEEGVGRSVGGIVERERGEGRDCIFIRAWNATDRALITSQAILSIDRFAVWSFEPGRYIGRPTPFKRGEREVGEESRVCNLCRWHVQKLADNGAVANPKN